MTADEHAADRYELGQSVRIPTTTGAAFGTVVGYGAVEPARLEPPSEANGALILIELFPEYRGTVMPSSWHRPIEPPSVGISIVTAHPDNVTAIGLCRHCARPIEQTDDGRWIDSHSEPAASLVYCESQDDELTLPAKTRHTPAS